MILLGPPDVGKTHLAVAVGMRAINQGYGVYFIRAHDMLEDLRRAQEKHRLERRLRVCLAPRVLILDEFGVWPCDREATTVLSALISARYERGSVILTSNRGFAEWGGILGRRHHRHSDPRPPAASQPHPEHSRGELRPAREEAGRVCRGPPLAVNEPHAQERTSADGVGQFQTGAGGSNPRRR